MTLYEFDGIAALKALPEQEREWTKLSGILDGKPTQDMLSRVQSFFRSNRDRLIAVSRRCVQVNATVEAFYRERIDQVAQHETRGQDVQNRLEIERTAFNPYSGAPILPGSGLKGAIRTALLDHANNGRSLPADLLRDRNANLKLQQRLFGYQAGRFELDPMRLIRISDASAVDPDTAATQVRFAVNRKKTEVRVGAKLVDSQAEQRGLYQLLECPAPLQTRGFMAQLSVQQTGGIDSRHWPDASLRFNPASIAAGCIRFYSPVLEHEMTLLVELHEGDDVLPPLTSSEHAGEVVAWRAKVSERRARMLGELAQAQARAAEAELERQRVEREQAEREARLASLSNEERKLESLRELFRRDQAAGIKVEIIVLVTEDEQMKTATEADVKSASSLRAYFEELGRQPLTKKYTREEIDAYLAQERASWDQKEMRIYWDSCVVIYRIQQVAEP